MHFSNSIPSVLFLTISLLSLFQSVNSAGVPALPLNQTAPNMAGPWSGRWRGNIVSAQDKVVLIGSMGGGSVTTTLYDVWTMSVNQVSTTPPTPIVLWSQMSDAPWVNSSACTAVTTVGDSVYAMLSNSNGGLDARVFQYSVSTDSWTPVANGAWMNATSPRCYMNAVNMNGAIVMAGDLTHAETWIQDVPASSSSSWRRLPASAVMYSPSRSFFGFNTVQAQGTNYAFLIGGYVNNGAQVYLNDVWSLSDTSTNSAGWVRWADAPFSQRYDFAFTSYNNALWLMGGMDTSFALHNDIWTMTFDPSGLAPGSPAATSWNSISDGNFQPRFGARATVYRSALIMTMGSPAFGTFANDIWSTGDYLSPASTTSSTGGAPVVASSSTAQPAGGSSTGAIVASSTGSAPSGSSSSGSVAPSNSSSTGVVHPSSTGGHNAATSHAEPLQWLLTLALAMAWAMMRL